MSEIRSARGLSRAAPMPSPSALFLPVFGLFFHFSSFPTTAHSLSQLTSFLGALPRCIPSPPIMFSRTAQPARVCFSLSAITRSNDATCHTTHTLLFFLPPKTIPLMAGWHCT